MMMVICDIMLRPNPNPLTQFEKSYSSLQYSLTYSELNQLHYKSWTKTRSRLKRKSSVLCKRMQVYIYDPTATQT